METGYTAGTGKYSFHESHSGSRSVMVSHMPEDNSTVRIKLKDYGETMVPILTVSVETAELLWRALNRMAKDLEFGKYDELSPLHKGKT